MTQYMHVKIYNTGEMPYWASYKVYLFHIDIKYT